MFVLNDINVIGKPLKVGRPKTYICLMSIDRYNLLSNNVASI